MAKYIIKLMSSTFSVSIPLAAHSNQYTAAKKDRRQKKPTEYNMPVIAPDKFYRKTSSCLSVIRLFCSTSLFFLWRTLTKRIRVLNNLNASFCKWNFVNESRICDVCSLVLTMPSQYVCTQKLLYVVVKRINR